MADEKIQFTLGAAFTGRAAFEEQNKALKESRKEFKDMNASATGMLKGLADTLDNDLGKALNRSLGLLQTMATGGLWGAMGAAAQMGIGLAIEGMQRLIETASQAHDEVISLINQRIRSKTSARYGTTVIQVTDNDPVVAAMMADSVRVHLQRHTAAFARQTALFDLASAQAKCEQAERRYLSARDEYAHYVDTHNDLVSGIASAEEDHLQKEYEAAFTAYEKACEQRLRAQALVDKFSFTFTVLTNATVPQSPTSPSALGYLLSFVFIALTVTTWILLGRKKSQDFRRQILLQNYEITE